MKKQNQKKREIQLSQFFVKILHHHPETTGLRPNEKRCYGLNESKTKIRACQRLSTQEDAEGEKKVAPEILDHGRAQKFCGGRTG